MRANNATRSLWTDGAPTSEYPPLAAGRKADVAVVGGGVTGVTLALLLAERGVDVALLDANRLGCGVTGYTTAKVSSQHGLIYATLREKHGREKTLAYGEANEAGLAWVAERVERHDIECDWRRRPSYAYVLSREQRQQVEREAEVAAELGLPTRLVEDVPLPYPVEAAVRFESQGEFDPYRYTTALAREAEAAGVTIAEETRLTGVNGGEPCTLATDHGELQADQVVLATHYPMLDRSLAFARLYPMRSYCVAARIADEPPEGMFISAEGPTRSLRAVPRGGEELLIVGGEGHKSGEHEDTWGAYGRLESFAREHFDVESVDYRWSAQDPTTADGMPYVGQVTPLSKRVWMASGYAKWGFTNGTAAALILADRLLGRENAWAEAFEANRLRPRASAVELVKENANVGFHFVADRVRCSPQGELEGLAKGEGGVVRHQGDTVGGFRDDEGELHAVSLTCTHLYCRLVWNHAERSWDCPCHGSRFAPDGEVLEGPAVKRLERYPIL